MAAGASRMWAASLARRNRMADVQGCQCREMEKGQGRMWEILLLILLLA